MKEDLQLAAGKKNDFFMQYGQSFAEIFKVTQFNENTA